MDQGSLKDKKLLVTILLFRLWFCYSSSFGVGILAPSPVEYNSISKTAPATPGLLNKYIWAHEHSHSTLRLSTLLQY